MRTRTSGLPQPVCIATAIWVSVWGIAGCPSQESQRPSQEPAYEMMSGVTEEPPARHDASEAEKASFAELEKVKAALQPYIEAAKTGDGALSRSAFFDHAHIVGSIKGEFSELDADAFGEAISHGGPSPEVRHHIAWIDISGPAASARVEFIDWSGLRFTDFFVLYKHDGQWKISGKVYDSHANN